MQSRIESRPAKSDTHLSSPYAKPPWGGAPNLKASIKKPNCSCAFSGVKPISSNILFCSAIVNTNRSSTYFNAINHHVISIGSDGSRVWIKQMNIFGFGRGKRMVHSHESFRFFVPLKEREVDYPQAGKRILSLNPSWLPISSRNSQSCLRVFIASSPKVSGSNRPVWHRRLLSSAAKFPENRIYQRSISPFHRLRCVRKQVPLAPIWGLSQNRSAHRAAYEYMLQLLLHKYLL